MQQITDLAAYYSLTPSQYGKTVFHCSECGREHRIPINIVQSGQNLISSLPEIIDLLLPNQTYNIGIIYDRHIEAKINALFFSPFDQLAISYTRFPLGEHGLLLEASTEIGDEAADGMPANIDFLIGVGSGVICDLTKWIATKCHLPFLLMGTAASMNAYTSITGTMTKDKVKSTHWLETAQGVLMDATLLASAPHTMTCAGIGDLLARQVANADWKLSNLIRGTYFCPVPFEMMSRFQDAYLPAIPKIRAGDLDAMQKLSDAILVSGYSMTILDGETSPSSGSEHILSHFFDFQHEVFGKPKNLHGEQVGIGTIIMSTAFEILSETDPATIDVDEIQRRRLSLSDIQAETDRIFRGYSKVFDQVVSKKRIPDEDFPSYISHIIQSWESLWKGLQPYLMPAEKIKDAMTVSGGFTKLSEIQRTPEDALQALLYGSWYRSRYTILDLFWELGLFPEFAPVILERSGVLG
ncbi:MAG: iron-containing alcohol dehydrogenase [Brevefilum sp.]|nr:iron-containing alcohol dehydrogenase [Brevefilum sp.]